LLEIETQLHDYPCCSLLGLLLWLTSWPLCRIYATNTKFLDETHLRHVQTCYAHFFTSFYCTFSPLQDYISTTYIFEPKILHYLLHIWKSNIVMHLAHTLVHCIHHCGKTLVSVHHLFI